MAAAALYIFLACASLAAGAQSENSAILVGLVFAALFVFLALRQLGIVKKKTKKSSGNDPKVFVVQGGDKFHARRSCPYIADKQPYTMARSLAISQRMTPCKKCYPR